MRRVHFRGEAKSIFKKLQQCWNHANITRHRKFKLFRSIIVPTLMYNLESIWINQDSLNRINSFHVRCLRQICRIDPSFISRMPNSEIYALCGEPLLSMVLHKRQTKLYQSITELSENDVMRKLTCAPNSVYPKVWDHNRKRGRPKQQWAPCVFKLAIQMGTIVV